MPQTKDQTQKNKPVICIELLNTFTKPELDNFQKFISSSYFNSDIYIIRLLKLLIKKIINKVEFDDEKQRVVYEKVFLSKVKLKDFSKKEKRRLNDKLSKLTRLAEKFLVFEAVEENSGYYNDLLFKKLKHKKRFALFLRHSNKIKKQLENQQVKDIHFYYSGFINDYHLLDYQYKTGLLYQNKQYELDKINYNLDVYYILRKLSFNQTILCLEDNIMQKFDLSTMKPTFDLTNLQQYKNNKNILSNVLAVNFIKNKTEENYTNLLNVITQNSALFSKEDLAAFYVLLTNFCIQQINKGVFKHKELFKLYKMMDEHNLIIEDDFIPIIKLKSIIIMACRNNEFDWANYMLEKYIPYVRKSIRTSVQYLNDALIAFYQKEYEKALGFAIKVEDNINLFYDKSCRILILKCHFELDEDYDYRTERIYRSSEKYFKNIKSFSKNKKQGYANFMNIFINLYKIKHQNAKNSLEKIEERLNLQEHNSDRYWLLTKIKELRNL